MFTSMANYLSVSLSSSTLCLCFLLLFFNIGEALKLVNDEARGQVRILADMPFEGEWCIPKPSSTDMALKQNIAYACKFVDCSLIQPGDSCFEPDNLMNHASVVMNLYFQKSGRNRWNCDFTNSGVIAITDPSYGDCKFEYKA